jgi:hypothetical protein
MQQERDKIFSDWINQEKNKSVQESALILSLIDRPKKIKPKLKMVSSK